MLGLCSNLDGTTSTTTTAAAAASANKQQTGADQLRAAHLQAAVGNFLETFSARSSAASTTNGGVLSGVRDSENAAAERAYGAFTPLNVALLPLLSRHEQLLAHRHHQLTYHPSTHPQHSSTHPHPSTASITQHQHVERRMSSAGGQSPLHLRLNDESMCQQLVTRLIFICRIVLFCVFFCNHDHFIQYHFSFPNSSHAYYLSFFLSRYLQRLDGPPAHSYRWCVISARYRAARWRPLCATAAHSSSSGSLRCFNW